MKRVHIAILVGALSITSLFAISYTVDATTTTRVEELSSEEIERLCTDNHVASSLYYAAKAFGYKIDGKQFIEEMGTYAELADTDEEIDLAESIEKVLDCDIEEATSIIEESDRIQTEQNGEA